MQKPKCRAPPSVLLLTCLSWSEVPVQNRCCFPLEGVLGAKVYFQGLLDVPCEWGCYSSFIRELVYPTAARGCFYSSQGFSPSPAPHPAPNPFSFSFSLKKHDCVIDLSYIFTTMQPPPHSSFRTVPAPWGFSSRSLYSIPVPSSL